MILILFLLFSVANADITKLPLPEEPLRKRIGFWLKIYSELTTQEGVIHDARYPEIIYEKIDFRGVQNNVALSSKQKEKITQDKIKKLKDFYTRLLLSIHKRQHQPELLNPTEKRVYELYIGINEGNKFFTAAHGKRVRFQLGQKDRFIQALFYSGRYLSMMENVFKAGGLPREIARLPLVESSFNIKARSKVGASGLWQFMRSTGKVYLTINDVLDERNDPLRATEAASALMKTNFLALGNWPMAITAYNHGRKGMMRAQAKLGTESLAEVIDNYRPRSFGFASSNFYACFMAAVEVEKNAEKYFGKIDRDKALDFNEIVLNDFIDIQDLSTYTAIPLETLIEFNPSLSDDVVKGKFYIPRGFALRVPLELREQVLARYGLIPSNKKHSTQKKK